MDTENKLPSNLYRYDPLNKYSFHNLIKSQIFLNRPENFNDPLEFLSQICPKKTTPTPKGRNPKRIPAGANVNFSSVHRMSLEQHLSNYGCYCLSHQQNNILMWAHYTQGHQGFCLEFDCSQKPFNNSLKVNYSHETPIITNSYLPEAESSLKEDKTLKQLLTTKSIHWQYEEEFRILKPIRKPKDQILRYPPEALKSVYFGIKMSQFLRYVLYKILSDQNPQTKFFNTRLSEKSYEFSEPVPYDPEYTGLPIVELMITFSQDHINSIIKECAHLTEPKKKTDTTPLFEELMRYKEISDRKLEYKFNLKVDRDRNPTYVV